MPLPFFTVVQGVADGRQDRRGLGVSPGVGDYRALLVPAVWRWMMGKDMPPSEKLDMVAITVITIIGIVGLVAVLSYVFGGG